MSKNCLGYAVIISVLCTLGLL